jgi:transglycosylase-like protein with SLT domain
VLLAAGLIALQLSSPRIVSAAEVTIPLSIDYITLAEALKHRVYSASGNRAELWTGSDQCQYLYVTNPRFARQDPALKLETDGELSLGVAVAGKCVAPITWSGIVDITMQPYVGADLAIKFRVANINLYNSKHEKSVLVGRGFDLIKGTLIPRLETFSFDLKTPLHQIEELALAAAAPDVAERVRSALLTLRPKSAVVPEDDALRLPLVLNVEEAATPTPSAPAPPLSPTEVAAWQTMLDNWDAFIVFAIKQLGGATADKRMREQLFELLLDSRYRLVQALTQPETSMGPDPVRLLFLEDWSRLHAIIQSAAQGGMLGDHALEFLSFVTAGDALFALDQAAPALGIRISADDLRRLAHMMAPRYAADPLVFSYDTDPQLQQMFGIIEPLKSPGPVESPVAEETSTKSIAASPSATPGAPIPALSPAPAPTPVLPESVPASTRAPAAVPSPAAMIDMLPRLLGPADAEAAEDPLASRLLSIGAALRRVVVDEDNAPSYERSVETLLTLTTERESNDERLEARQRRNYLVLMKATAWQESCWRQFVRIKGRVRFLQSDTGDVGMMQVNKHVWRGLYNIPRLEWDIVYNSGAGAEILMRLMRGAAARATSKSVDPSAEIARASYAAYNGGPNAYDRWRRTDEPAELRQIDDAFQAKYRAMAGGETIDILRCSQCDKPQCNDTN